MKLIILLGLLFSYSVQAQNNAAAAFEEDFELGGDIFTDFSEDLTTADMAKMRDIIAMDVSLVFRWEWEPPFMMVTEVPLI